MHSSKWHWIVNWSNFTLTLPVGTGSVSLLSCLDYQARSVTVALPDWFRNPNNTDVQTRTASAQCLHYGLDRRHMHNNVDVARASIDDVGFVYTADADVYGSDGAARRRATACGRQPSPRSIQPTSWSLLRPISQVSDVTIAPKTAITGEWRHDRFYDRCHRCVTSRSL